MHKWENPVTGEERWADSPPGPEWKVMTNASGTVITKGMEENATGNRFVEVGGRLKLINPTTGQIVFDYGPTTAATVPLPSKNGADTKNIGGRVMQWNPATQQYDIDLGSSSAPSAPTASPRPSIEVGPDGTVVAFDPNTGRPTVMGNVPELASRPDLQFEVDPRTGDLIAINPQTGVMKTVVPGFGFKQYSPVTLRQQVLTDLQSSRTFATGERLGGQQFATGERLGGQQFATGERLGGEQFTSGENRLTRAQTALENSIDRAASASQFAANFGIDTGRFNLQREQELAAQQRNIRNDSLAAAEQFANLVSLTDPAALPAFFEAGGGTIQNALARGVDALSDNALLPAARSLQAAEAPVRSTVSFGDLPSFNPFQFKPNEFQSRFANAPIQQPVQQAPVQQQTPVQQPAPVQQPGPIASFFQGAGQPAADALSASLQASGADPARIAELQQIAARQAAQAAATGRMINQQGGIARLAHGGTTNAGVMQVGERAPEVVFNPTGAPLTVIPDAIAQGAPGFQEGTLDPADIPFVDRVRMIRRSVDTSDPLGVGPFDTRFRFLAPSLQQRFLAGRQTKFGIPLQDQQAEINRFALQGVNRGQFQFGI